MLEVAVGKLMVQEDPACLHLKTWDGYAEPRRHLAKVAAAALAHTKQGGEVLEVPDEEVQPQKDIQTSDMPLQANMAETRSNGYLPYGDWCPDCIAGSARKWAHRYHNSGSQQPIPLISCDYLHISSTCVFARNELPEEELQRALKVLVD